MLHTVWRYIHTDITIDMQANIISTARQENPEGLSEAYQQEMKKLRMKNRIEATILSGPTEWALRNIKAYFFEGQPK